MTKKSKAVLAVVLILGLGVGGLVGVLALTRGNDSAAQSVKESSGKIVAPPGKPYSVEIPKGMVTVPKRRDTSIPSETDLSLELEGKAYAGGLIKTGTLSGKAATGTFEEVGDAAAQKYAAQYGGHPDKWGKGAKVDKTTIELDGRSAVEINARFSPNGKADPSIFFRIYFVDAPSGSPILITCDWNTNATASIADACDTLVASFKAKGS